MTIIKAKNRKDTEELLSSGIHKVELEWEIGSDDFFRLASYWCERGAKITKGRNHFIISLKGLAIPPND